MNTPIVSILIAARNEEANILDLLYSIEALNYPKNDLQVLIGDDSSIDKTAQIIDEFILQKPYIQLVRINKSVANLKGKANVLAQLALLANGKYYFFTDADIELPTHWIEEMLNNFEEKTGEIGVVTGSTVIKYKNAFQACQAIEWLGALRLIKILEKYKYPVTGMGNNMAVSAEAYLAVGGYEKIGFSIVEDYALFRAIVEKGYEFRQVFNKGILAETKPPKDLRSYFYQRKRWMVGGFQSKSILMLLAIIQALFLPILLIISVFSLKIALLVWLVKFLLQTFFSARMLRIIEKQDLIKYLFSFELYMLIFPFCQLVFYFLPVKTIWKDRAY